MTMGEVVEFIDRFAAFSRAPVRTHTAVTAVARDGDGYHVDHDDGEFRCRRWSSRAARATGRTSRRVARRHPAVHPACHAVRLPQPVAAAGRRRAGRRAIRNRRAAGRRDPSIGTARDALGRRARPAAADVSRPRRPLVDGRRSACGTSVTTKWTISRARGGCPRRSSSGRRSARRSISTPSPRWASSWWDACRPCATDARSSRAGCATCSRSPI